MCSKQNINISVREANKSNLGACFRIISSVLANLLVERMEYVKDAYDTSAQPFAGRACEQCLYLLTVCLVEQAGCVTMTYLSTSWLGVSWEITQILSHEKRLTKCKLMTDG